MARISVLLGMVVLCASLLFVRSASAHELAIDQLTLFPDPGVGQLRGQILFDPKLTRANNALGLAAITTGIVGFLRENLRIEADGRPVGLSFAVREIWTGDGAIGGDSVMLKGALPRGVRELRVFAGEPLQALAVSVESPGVAERATPKNTLLLGGDWTPAFRLVRSADNPGWREGDPELLSLEIPRPSTWDTAKRYVRLGVHHILPLGWDHVLFVAGLVLGSRRRHRALLAQLGAFTLAHTATLALGALGLIVLSARVVEPLIALSIAFVAIENLVRKGEPRYRAAWAFGFGLLHGQGFASGLVATGIPKDSFLTALFSFNVGVELGQLVVVAGLLLVLHGLRDPDRFYRYAVRPGSVAIALLGLYWGVERLVT